MISRFSRSLGLELDALVIAAECVALVAAAAFTGVRSTWTGGIALLLVADCLSIAFMRWFHDHVDPDTSR